MREYVHSASTLSLRNPSPGAGKRGAPSELDKARAETELMRAQAKAERESAEQLRATLRKSTRDAKVRMRATAVILMTAALLKIAWEAAYKPEPVPTPITAQPSSPSPGAQIAAKNAPLADQSEGALALERLRTAFHSFPGEDQMDVVREVNERRWGPEMTCPLVWNDAGVPALYVGDKKGEMPPPLVAKALNHCAGGIERLRAERDSNDRQ